MNVVAQLGFLQQRKPGSRSQRIGCRHALGLLLLLPVHGIRSDPAPTPVAVTRARVEDSLRLEARAALRRGCRNLVSRQLPDGSWAEHPAVTSLATLALLNAGPLAEIDSQHVDAALNFIGRRSGHDHALESAAESQYPVFSTAVSMLALIRADRPQDQAALRQDREFLLSSQVTGVPDTDPRAGGFRQAAKTFPDLTTTEYVLEALYLSDYLDRPPQAAAPEAGPRADAVYARAAAFIGRCQIMAAQDAHSGGFGDHPPQPSEALQSGPPRSAGYLLCAGLKSLLYANVPVADPRVQAAVVGLNRIYTVESNPGAGMAGYYTYLYTLTKALAAWEQRTPSAPAVAIPAAWRRQATAALLVRQGGDGSWRQQAPDWWENRTELTTAYALLTLELTLDEVRLAPPAILPPRP